MYYVIDSEIPQAGRGDPTAQPSSCSCGVTGHNLGLLCSILTYMLMSHDNQDGVSETAEDDCLAATMSDLDGS